MNKKEQILNNAEKPKLGISDVMLSFCIGRINRINNILNIKI